MMGRGAEVSGMAWVWLRAPREVVALVAVYTTADVVLWMLSDVMAADWRLREFLLITVLVSQSALVAIWLGLGSWPLVGRIGATWLYVVTLIFLLVPGPIDGKKWQEACAVTLLLHWSAVPAWIARLNGARLRQPGGGESEENGTEGGRGAERPWQFSTGELLGWTAAVGMLGALARWGEVDLSADEMYANVSLFVVPSSAVTMNAFAILTPRDAKYAWLWGGGMLAVTMMFLREQDRLTALATLALTQGALVFLRVNGVRIVFEEEERARAENSRGEEMPGLG